MNTIGATAFILLIPLASWAEMPSYLRGKVLLESGVPVSNYPVIIEDPLGSASVVLTDKSGNFEAPITEYGDYLARPSSEPSNYNVLSKEAPSLLERILPSISNTLNEDLGDITISPFE